MLKALCAMVRKSALARRRLDDRDPALTLRRINCDVNVVIKA